MTNKACLGFSREEIEYICSVYDGSSEVIDGLQERWPEHPRWHFTRVGQHFGLAKRKQPRWSTEDQTFLVVNRHRLSPKRIGERLGRSETGVRLKLKRLGYKWIQEVNGFQTMRAVGRLFGVDDHTVQWWIEMGWMKAGRFPLGFGVHRAWKISHDAIYEFIEDEEHWHLWEPGRMQSGDFRGYAEEIRAGTGIFLTTGELGSLAYYSHSWIQDLISRGIIKASKHGPNWKIAQEEADRFLREYCP